MSDLLTGKPWAHAPWELVTADISANALRICLAIQLHRRPDGQAPFPSQRRLGEMCHVSIQTVERAVKELKESGILKCTQRVRATGERSANAYEMAMPQPSRMRDGQPSRVRGGPPLTDEGAEVDFSVGSSKQEGERLTPPPRERARTERDDLWDALASATGIDPETNGERSRFGKSVNELLAAGATGTEIAARAARWPMRFPKATLTDRALVNHWGELAGKGGADVFAAYAH